MAWIAPPDWVNNTTITEANLDTLSNDLKETSAAVVTTSGDTTYADGPNSMARLAKGTAGMVYRQGASFPEWADLKPRRAGDRSSTGSVSSVGTQKTTCTLDIPSAWSGGWTLQAWGVVRLIWNGSATTGDIELLVGGSSFTPSTEQDVFAANTGPLSVIGYEAGLTATGNVVVGLMVTGNGTADYADAWVTAQAERA